MNGTAAEVEMVREGKGHNTLEEKQLVPCDLKTFLVLCMIASSIDSARKQNDFIVG